MRNPAQSRIDKVTVMSLGTALGVYTVVAVAGFMTYGDAVESNILISYPSKRSDRYRTLPTDPLALVHCVDRSIRITAPLPGHILDAHRKGHG